MPTVMIIGGGVAGAAAAVRLARAGREVVLLEREPGPHDKVCGEFLSYEAIDALERLEIDLTALGAAPVEHLAVCAGARRTMRPLPFRAASLSRRVLDEAVLGRAEAEGAEIIRGQRVSRLERSGQSWIASTTCGRAVRTDQVFLATGKHDLRGWGRPGGKHPGLIGFKVHLELPAAHIRRLERQVCVHLYPGGYAGLERVEDGRANLCLVVDRRVFADCGRDWPALVTRLAGQCPRLAPVLYAGRAAARRPLAVSGIPYGHVQSEADEGLWRLGDQAAVIPSFAGEGMAIALRSAELACEFLLQGRDSKAYQRALARQVRVRVLGATLLSRTIVTEAGLALAGRTLGLAPDVMRWIAHLTRLPAARAAAA
jgi:menaquinone-9 beta-reductase